RLNPDQTDETAATRVNIADRALDVDDRVALVIGLDRDIDVWPEHFGGGTFGHEAVSAREAVGGDGGAQPLDDVAVLIVVRRLDQDRREYTFCHVPHPYPQAPSITKTGGSASANRRAC